MSLSGKNIQLSSSAQRVQNALQAHGFALKVVELPESTRSASEAAQAIGCQVGQIAKSLIFKGLQSGDPILVIASGHNRVNEKTIAALVDEPIEKANAEFVRRATGFSIGGVPPVGHLNPLTPYIDQDLLTFNEIWAAAGTPFAVFTLSPAILVELTGGSVVSII